MMRTRNEGLPSHDLLGPASADEVAVEERLLGVALPPSLQVFLLRHNGGWFYQTMVRFYSVGPYDYRFSRHNAAIRDEDDSWPAERIAFATDGGLGVFCFDAAKRSADGECPLLYFPWQERRVEPIGPSLDAFLPHLERMATIRFGVST